MNLYLAAPWADRAQMGAISTQFEQAGHRITHKWWECEDVPEDQKNDALHRWHATLDRDGVLRADRLILINTSKSEGKAVEQGIAMTANIPIIAVGKLGGISKNVFHYLPDYTWVDYVEEAVALCQQT